MRMRATFTAVLCSIGSLAGSGPFAPVAAAQRALLASDGQQLYRIDTTSFAVELVGPMPMVAPGAEFFHGGLETDLTGTLYSMTKHRFYRVDPDTAETTFVGLLNAGLEVFEGGLAFHPVTGEALALNAGTNTSVQLMKVDTLTGQVTLLGRVPPGWHDFNGLVFDESGALFAIQRPSNTLWRIDPTNPGGPGTHPIGAGLGAGLDLGDAGGLTRDPVTGILWGYAVGSHALFTVDTVSGLATVKKAFDGTVPLFYALAVGGCPSIFSYGFGCAGAGGHVPSLEVTTCPTWTGQTVQLEITGALGGAKALVVLGAGRGNTPMEAGCALLVHPLFAPVIVLPLGGSGAGNGAATLGGVMPAGLPTPFSFAVQVFVDDPGGQASFSHSPGVEVFVDF